MVGILTIHKVSSVLAVMTVISHITLIAVLLGWAYTRKKSLPKQVETIWNIGKAYAWELALVVLISGMVGSLFYSDIALYEPCLLCWYQRILIYPQVFIIAAAMVFKLKSALPKLLLPLNGIGAPLALFHYIVQRASDFSGVDIATPCRAGGECSSKFVFYYGYVTIPFMALTVFVLLLAVIIITWKNKKE